MPSAITKTEILSALQQLPEDKQVEVLDFIKFLGHRSSSKKQLVSKSLKGIWKNIGFEKIDDLENEVTQVRSEMEESIIKRAL